MSDEISMIPIGQICIVNPRYRDQKKFELIVENIKNVGLKMPIRVSPRTAGEQNGFKYDLVCGQGRLEAFKVLGYAEIPAMVGELPREELLLCSLVENIARRYPQPMDLLREIERLKAEGYSYAKIAEKIDAHEDLVRGLAALKSQGEERLLDAALKGKIPMWIAVDIAKTDTLETQRDLLKAYENKQLTRAALKYIKGLIVNRRLIGKQRGIREQPVKSKNSVASMVEAYRREGQRQKLMIKKAQFCEHRLNLIITAFNKLLADEHFCTLLRAEALATMPKFLSVKLNPKATNTP